MGFEAVAVFLESRHGLVDASHRGMALSTARDVDYDEGGR